MKPSLSLSELHESGMMLYTFDPHSCEVEAGGLGVQCYPSLHSIFAVGLKYIRKCLKGKRNVRMAGKRMKGRKRQREEKWLWL